MKNQLKSFILLAFIMTSQIEQVVSNINIQQNINNELQKTKDKQKADEHKTDVPSQINLSKSDKTGRILQHKRHKHRYRHKYHRKNHHKFLNMINRKHFNNYSGYQMNNMYNSSLPNWRKRKLTGFEGIGASLGNAFQGIAGGAGNIINQAGKAVGSTVNGVGNAVGSTVNGAGNALGQVGQAAGSTISGAGQGTANVIDGVSSGVGQVGSGLDEGGDAIGKSLGMGGNSGTGLLIGGAAAGAGYMLRKKRMKIHKSKVRILDQKIAISDFQDNLINQEYQLLVNANKNLHQANGRVRDLERNAVYRINARILDYSIGNYY